MAKPIFSNLDNLSLQDIESEAELIPLLTSEDEEALEKEGRRTAHQRIARTGGFHPPNPLPFRFDGSHLLTVPFPTTLPLMPTPCVTKPSFQATRETQPRCCSSGTRLLSGAPG